MRVTRYEVMHDVCGHSFVCREDGAGRPEEIVAALRDSGKAERVAKALNAGDCKELDALLEETEKPDSAWAIVWCFVIGVSAVGGWAVGTGLVALLRWIF